MRVIKVKAWNADNNEWLKNDDITMFLNGSVSVFRNKPLSCDDFPIYYPLITLVQYTGLNDKQGNEIYEGDIVKWDASDEVNEICFELGAFCWEDNGGGAFRIGGWCENMEVIGNIYENLDLLASKKEEK